MNQQAKTLARVSKAEFYAFASQTYDARYEYEDGYIVQQMPGATKRHHKIVMNIIRVLDKSLKPDLWVIYPEFGVETSVTIRFPDVVVGPVEEPDDSQATNTPAWIFEVLSPSSRSRDLLRKPKEYLSLSSLQAYVVASQEAPELAVWLRSADGTAPDEPTELVGLDERLVVPSLDVTLPLRDIYTRVTFKTAQPGAENDNG
ncbi:MAG: Uma2 family endonuclease [Pseudomonadota bacterium]